MPHKTKPTQPKKSKTTKPKATAKKKSASVEPLYRGHQAIRRLRIGLGLSQPDLSSLLGAHRLTLIRWEQGTLLPSPLQALLIEYFKLALEREPEIGKRVAEEMLPGNPVPGLKILLAEVNDRKVEIPKLDRRPRTKKAKKGAKKAVKATRKASANGKKPAAKASAKKTRKAAAPVRKVTPRAAPEATHEVSHDAPPVASTAVSPASMPQELVPDAQA
jgi:DNA-binding transcriptional regulator YiaG